MAPKLITTGLLACGVMAFAFGAFTQQPKSAAIKTESEKMYSKSGHKIERLDKKKVEQLAIKLTPEERKILLSAGTEAAFCGNLLDNKLEGTYTCKLCGLPLFSSNDKFKSGTGWPSFFQPFDKDHIHYEEDTSFGMKRVEIECTRCRGHLGHVFEDGPKPTGLRYCLNSASLDFIEKGDDVPEMSRPVNTETAYFAGGCFWGVEDRFQKVPGVIDAASGYQNGQKSKPTYREVCSGSTGHAESVRVVFDPKAVKYATLLEYFFQFHNPTQLNRQGPDVGDQYRSAIFTTSDEQLATAREFVARQQASERFRDLKIVTIIEPAETFWEAEEYHQDYNVKNGHTCAITPIP